MKKLYKLNLIVVAVLFLTCGLYSINYKFIVPVRAGRTNELLDAEFNADSVVVTLTREETLKFKEYTKDDFKEVDCDLTVAGGRASRGICGRVAPWMVRTVVRG